MSDETWKLLAMTTNSAPPLETEEEEGPWVMHYLLTKEVFEEIFQAGRYQINLEEERERLLTKYNLTEDA